MFGLDRLNRLVSGEAAGENDEEPSHIFDSWRRLKLLSKKSNYIHNRELTVCSSWTCGQGAARGRALVPSRFKSARGRSGSIGL